MLPRLSSFLPVVLAAAVSPAAAQPAAPAPLTQSIDAGLQWALLISGRDAKPGAQLSWRRWFSPHLGVGTYTRWGRKHTTSEFNSPAQAGPDGIVIPAMQGRDERGIESYGFGAGVLARTSFGRLSLIGGTGAGFYVDRTAHDSRINTAHHTGSSTARSIGLYMLMEMEVRATRHVSGYAGLGAELRDVRFPDSSFGYPVAGVRAAF